MFKQKQSLADFEPRAGGEIAWLSRFLAQRQRPDAYDTLDLLTQRHGAGMATSLVKFREDIVS